MSASADPFEGLWEVEDGHRSELQLVTPKDKPVTFSIKSSGKGDGNEYKLVASVKNRFMGTVRVVKMSKDGNKASVTVGGLASTRMMPPKDLVAAEDFVSKVFPTIETMEFEGDKLLLLGKDVLVRSHAKLEGSS